MAIFNPVDMMGPAHRGAQIQKLAQNAAQNVMRRQRMRSLIHAGASVAGRGAGGASGGVGGGIPFQSSMRARPQGTHSTFMRPPGGPQSIAEILASAGQRAQSPSGGFFGNAGGGFDFTSLPDPNDPRQATPDTMPRPGLSAAPPAAPAAPDAAPSADPTAAPVPTNTTTATPPAPQFYTGPDGQPASYSPAAPAPGTFSYDTGVVPTATGTATLGSAASVGVIPLGNNMYYDPVTDSIHGGGAFTASRR
jgi:hypothetical protein